MFLGVDWSRRGDYITQKHGITPAEANEALADPYRVALDPDPASETGLTVRIIGRSESHGVLLTVIVLDYDGHEYGVNAWKSSPKDRRRYKEID